VKLFISNALEAGKENRALPKLSYQSPKRGKIASKYHWLWLILSGYERETRIKSWLLSNTITGG
jgi:hypothetical protein